VVEALLRPETVERLRAVRRYVESPTPDGAPFPPPPTPGELPVPLYGYTTESALQWWQTRHISSVGARALQLLYNRRQYERFQEDMDVPWWQDTRAGRAATAAAGAGDDGAESRTDKESGKQGGGGEVSTV
jgi:hypothetical protein